PCGAHRVKHGSAACIFFVGQRDQTPRARSASRARLTPFAFSCIQAFVMSQPAFSQSVSTDSLHEFLDRLKARDPAQPEFHQAVKEVFESIWPFIEANPKYRRNALLERLVEPE